MQKGKEERMRNRRYRKVRNVRKVERERREKGGGRYLREIERKTESKR
jgi:hypothetical protein